MIGCIFTYVLVDTVVSTVLYLQWSRPTLNAFLDDVLDFDVHRSVLDLWVMHLLGSCVLFGASVGVLKNQQDGPKRVASSDTLMVLIGLTMLSYALAKLLIFSETGALMHNPWFLSLFSWTCVSAMGCVFFWKLLSKADVTSSGEGDRETLVDAGEEEEQVEADDTRGKEAKQKANSGATLGRLLSYCKEDAGLLSLAFFFLLLSAVCEFIHPYTPLTLTAIIYHYGIYNILNCTPILLMHGLYFHTIRLLAFIMVIIIRLSNSYYI